MGSRALGKVACTSWLSDATMSLAGCAVEQCSCRVGVSCVARSLVDQVERHPPQILSPGPSLRIGDPIECHRPDRRVGRGCPSAIRVERSVDAQIDAGCELRLSAAHLDSAEPAVDPSPLDMRQVVDDSKQRDQSFAGSPARLRIVQTVEISDHGTPEVSEPLQQQLPLVGVARWESDVVVRHIGTVSPPRRTADPRISTSEGRSGMMRASAPGRGSCRRGRADSLLHCGLELATVSVPRLNLPARTWPLWSGDLMRAHLIRTARSPGLLLHGLGGRAVAYVQGACIGAGTELPAFCARVTARRDATFQLPEVAMGLIPGAGGTVSVTRRIGRQRTAWLAISGTALDASTADRWGLVDALVD